MRWGMLIIGLLSLSSHGCSHGDGRVVPAAPQEEGVRLKGGSVSARIWVLIARGQFAEAEALIAEGSTSGLIGKETAQKMLERIAVLSTKLGEIPATLQRARDFPSQLKDFTCFQIKSMLEAGDYSLATEAQLKMAVKLIEQQSRLMDKL
jgi:hypothetical protein